MSFSKEAIDITPDKSLMITLGSTGYTVPQAIAELVDNSIDERVENQPVKVKVTISAGSIKVEDNARGMTPQEARDAFVLGKSTKAGKLKLGLYGLGLKTACASLGSWYYLKTKSEGEDRWFILEFDEDQWLSDNKLTWNNYPVHWIVGRKKDHGTIVEIGRPKRSIPPFTSTKILEDFAVRYHPFLENRQAEVLVNGRPCLPRELELTEKHGFDKILPSGHRIYGWFGLLKESSQKGYYGFTTFRNGRMITCYDKIGFNAHPSLARIVGELNLDHVQVTHDKRDFQRDCEAFLEVDTILRVNPEFRTLQQRARLPQKLSKEPASMSGDANRVEDRDDKTIGDVLSSVVKVRLQDRCPVCDEVLNQPNPLCPSCGSDTGLGYEEKVIEVPEDGSDERSVKVDVDGTIIEVNHKFANIGRHGGMFRVERESGTIKVVTNTAFPAVKCTKDRRLCAALSVAFALALATKPDASYNGGDWFKVQQRFLEQAPEIMRTLQEIHLRPVPLGRTE